MAVPEAMAKAEGNDAVGDLLHAAAHLGTRVPACAAGPGITVAVALRFCRSPSLPLRLLGWDHVETLVG